MGYPAARPVHTSPGIIGAVVRQRLPDAGPWTFDRPFLLLATWLVLAFLWQGRVGRVEGSILLAVYAAYLLLHVVVR